MDGYETSSGNEAIGVSSAFLDLQERLARAARVARPVVLIGERGTGKELAAARIHRLSARWNKPYVALNCAALAPTLIESELFGHEAGAFTGAIRRRKGRFEQADTGSFFLDEIATIPIPAQEKVLRAVEYGEFERVGGAGPVRVDVRLIAATNVDLRRMAREGRFREDLLDRLSFEVITLPPLRARREDILPLAAHFARRMAREMGLEETPMVAEPAARALLEYAWPGNIRELKNVVERMVYRAAGPVIEEASFDPFESPHTPEWRGEEATNGSGLETAASSEAEAPITKYAMIDLDSMSLPDAVREYESRRLNRALEENRFNQKKAAESLGMTYHQFRALYRKFFNRR